MSVTLALLLSAVAVTPLPPYAVTVPLAARAGLERDWGSALESAPACSQLALRPPSEQLLRETAACNGVPACLAGSLRRTGATHALQPRVEGRRVDFVIAVSIIAADGTASGPLPKTVAKDIGWAFAELAEEACTLLFSAELELDAPDAPDELALELPSAEPLRPAPPVNETIPLVHETTVVTHSASTVRELSTTPPPSSNPSSNAAVTSETLAAVPLQPPLDLGVKTAPVVPPTSPEERSLLPVGAWVSFGVAVAASAGGVAFGTRALGAAGARDASATAVPFAEAQLRAEREGLRANVAWGVASTAALTGLLFWLADVDVDSPPEELP